MRVTGFCNRCGDCCRHLILPLPAHEPLLLRMLGIILPLCFAVDEPTREWLRVRGCRVATEPRSGREMAWVPIVEASGAAQRLIRPEESPGDVSVVRRQVYAGKPAVWIASQCPHVSKRGKCGLHGTNRKPLVCAGFPSIHNDLSDLPRCSYRIEDG